MEATLSEPEVAAYAAHLRANVEVVVSLHQTWPGMSREAWFGVSSPTITARAP